MSTNWPGASEGAIGVTLLRVREGVVFHFIIPGLHMERGWTIPGEMCKHTQWLQCSIKKTFQLSCVSVSEGAGTSKRFPAYCKSSFKNHRAYVSDQTVPDLKVLEYILTYVILLMQKKAAQWLINIHMCTYQNDKVDKNVVGKKR